MVIQHLVVTLFFMSEGELQSFYYAILILLKSVFLLLNVVWYSQEAIQEKCVTCKYDLAKEFKKQ